METGYEYIIVMLKIYMRNIVIYRVLWYNALYNRNNI